MLDIIGFSKIVYNECHEQGESEHDHEACQKDPGEVVVMPRFNPVMYDPLTPQGSPCIVCRRAPQRVWSWEWPTECRSAYQFPRAHRRCIGWTFANTDN